MGMTRGSYRWSPDSEGEGRLGTGWSLPAHTLGRAAFAVHEARDTVARMDNCGRSRRLSRTEEHRLVCEAREDVAAKEQVIEALRPLIGSVARTYRNAGVEREELMQEGAVGVLRALDRFDPELGTPFWAYATWWVRQAMQQLVAQTTRPVVLSDRALRLLARITDARRTMGQTSGMEPRNVDLADATGIPLEQVDRLLAVAQTPRGLEDPIGVDGDGTTTVGERVPDPSAEEDYERVVDDLETRELRGLCGECLAGRERYIVHAHYGLGCRATTLREIAAGMGLSVERVRQLEERALRKVRERFERNAPGSRAQCSSA
jgi:RNA polymerase primary sigma factor